MHILAELVEVVIGVDTHKHPYRRGRGGRHRRRDRPGDRAGHPGRLSAAAGPGRPAPWSAGVGDRGHRGGYGAGLTRFLHSQREQVVELDRPKRATRRHGAKSDPIDATRAAREALSRDRLAQPRSAGPRAALQARLTVRRSAVQAATDALRQLHALVTAAPDSTRPCT
jgi:transposase